MAWLLKADGLHMEYGMQALFDIARIEIDEGDRIALVGINGSGKTTLLRVLAGDLVPISGRVARAAAAHYLPQIDPAAEPASDALRGRWGVYDVPEEGASGGERVRAKLAAAFDADAGLLLLDEPTANLDADGMSLLERAIAGFRGAVVVVSHDRALMDAVATEVWELEDGGLTIYPGNYTAYWCQRRHARETAWREYRAYREEEARLRNAIVEKQQTAASIRKAPARMGNSEARLQTRGKAFAAQEKIARQAKAIASRIGYLEKPERPAIEPDLKAAMALTSAVTSRTAAYVRGYTAHFGDRIVLRGAEASVPSGRRTVVMGPNGSGKTTLLRALLSGEGHLAPDARVGLFDQAHDRLDPRNTLLENAMADSIRPEWAARAVLARLGLVARDVHKPAAALSGGERAKVLLARLLISDANFLVLDEPTNYLDLYAMGALEDLLAHYEGTLLLVTHDRALADAVAHRLLWVEAGRVTAFEGGYAGFIAARTAPSASARDEAMAAEILRMRMAELGARIDRATEKEKAALNAEYAGLARTLRASDPARCGG